MNKNDGNGLIRAKRTIAKADDINASVEKLYESYFSRYMVISDIINRYVATSLKNEVNWLRFRAIISLMRPGKGTMTSTELARQLMRPTQNIAGLVESLARDGLIVKRRVAKDHRSFTIRLTHAGLAYLDQCLESIIEAEKEIRYCLNEDELEKTAVVVRKIQRHFVRLSGRFQRRKPIPRTGKHPQKGHSTATKERSAIKRKEGISRI